MAEILNAIVCDHSEQTGFMTDKTIFADGNNAADRQDLQFTDRLGPNMVMNVPLSRMLLDSKALSSGRARHGRQRVQSDGRHVRHTRRGHC